MRFAVMGAADPLTSYTKESFTPVEMVNPSVFCVEVNFAGVPRMGRVESKFPVNLIEVVLFPTEGRAKTLMSPRAVPGTPLASKEKP